MKMYIDFHWGGQNLACNIMLKHASNMLNHVSNIQIMLTIF